MMLWKFHDVMDANCYNDAIYVSNVLFYTDGDSVLDILLFSCDAVCESHVLYQSKVCVCYRK